MPFDFRAVGWREFGYDYDDPPHYGRPSEHAVTPGDVTSIYVHAWDVDTGEDHFFWVHSYLRLDEWENWLDLIGLSLEMHGMSLA